jgi:hypothetical protein
MKILEKILKAARIIESIFQFDLICCNLIPFIVLPFYFLIKKPARPALFYHSSVKIWMLGKAFEVHGFG